MLTTLSGASYETTNGKLSGRSGFDRVSHVPFHILSDSVQIAGAMRSHVPCSVTPLPSLSFQSANLPPIRPGWFAGTVTRPMTFGSQSFHRPSRSRWS